MSTKKTWKHHFLSSGIPLEYSVAEEFAELTNWQRGEFRYERKDEQGFTRVFSVDVHSTNLNLGSERNLRVETLVECKYRHDGTKWVFTPDEYDFFEVEFDELFVTFEECCANRQLNRPVLNEVSNHYPLCAKGIELLADNSNPKTIQEAVQQLRYAVIARGLDAINHQITMIKHPIIPNDPPPIFVIFPIIVTTAELWRLKPGTTVEDVRSAEEITAVAESHDSLVLLHPPDNLDSRHTLECFASIPDSYRQQLNICIEQRGFDPQNFADVFASRVPALFIVIRYDKLRSVMTNLFELFAHEKIVLGEAIKTKTGPKS
jgi:hypothetical protein